MPVWAPPDWRDPGAYAPVLAGGRQALTWELLRRDPAYRDFAARRDCGSAGIADWGLHFPG